MRYHDFEPHEGIEHVIPHKGHGLTEGLQDIKFAAVTMISNPKRFKSRYNLYKKFEAEMIEAGVPLFTVELQQGERAFQVTEAGNPMNLQIRTYDEFWHKENCLNLGIQQLCRVIPGVEYIAWLDADISFATHKDTWKQEIIHALQHYDVVQCFVTAADHGPDGRQLAVYKSFLARWIEEGDVFKAPVNNKYAAYGHPGYAWAARRSALGKMGGRGGPLVDTAALGSGDRHMAFALIGKAEQSLEKNLTEAYKNVIRAYGDRCVQNLKMNVGYVPLHISHSWHGKKADRRYHDRWKILVDCKYDPNTDIYPDENGIFKLHTYEPRQIEFRNRLRQYFAVRGEDSIDFDNFDEPGRTTR
jgi:hypothetical protein